MSLKNIIKKAAKKESVMGKLGDAPYEDPMEPWSAKYGQPIKEEEDSMLFRYIRSLGFDPNHIDTGTRRAYARSSAFRRFKMGHSFEKDLKKEEVENLDEAGVGLLMNFIKAKGLDPTSMGANQKQAYSRSSEFRLFKRQHKMSETSGMGERGDDWNEEKKAVKEEVDEKDTVTLDIPLMIRIVEYAREDAKTDMDLHRIVENLINLRHEGVLTMDHYDQIVNIKKMKEEVEQIDELKKIPDNMDADDHITREEKTMKGKDPCWKGYQMVGHKMKNGKKVPNCVPEETQSLSAESVNMKKERTKSARMIKSLYKKGLKETMYDWEKNDKGETNDSAKIVMSGGKTLTGKQRNTVEIEPLLKTRPNMMKNG